MFVQQSVRFSFCGRTGAMPLSTAAANDAFKAAFTANATTALDATAGMRTSSELYDKLGKLWATAEAEVAKLKDADDPVPLSRWSWKLVFKFVHRDVGA